MKVQQETVRQTADRYLIPETGADLGKVLALCLPCMQTICPEPEEGWLMYSYAFLQARFFPENFTVAEPEKYGEGVLFYLEVLNRIFIRERSEIPFDARRDFRLMQPEEEKDCGISEEYRRFEKCFLEGYAYAYLRLSRVCTPYNTLGHVAGVHHVAMYMTRQLLGTEVEVDPGLMSAAAMVHDMGKFGCRPAEARRVPYLHYYYTYQFCRRFDLPVIGSIASNHSVWDLELDNLSCESLLLIYADFRVKSVFDEKHREQIHFWTLKDAFDVILSKLDNVDEAKRQRYIRVYARLKDFEDYLIFLGCDTRLDTEDGHPLAEGVKETNNGHPLPEGVEETEKAHPLEPTREEAPDRTGVPGSRYAVLMTEKEVVDRFRHLAIRYNLSVMHDAADENRFAALLEHIRSEKDWRHVRAFLTVAGEYSVYFPQELKKRLLSFLAEMMCHPEGDIRRQAAAIAGKMIADFEIRFTKEIPAGYECPRLGDSMLQAWEEFLDRIVSPGSFMQDRQIRWTGYAFKNVLDTLLGKIPEDKRRQVIHAYAGRCLKEDLPDLIRFILLDCASQIPYTYCAEEDARILSRFAALLAREKTGEIRAAAMWFLLGWLRQGFLPEKSYAHITGLDRETLARENYCFRYLDARINEFFGIPSEKGIGVYDLTNLYLENQRAGIPWIYKYLNLEILHKLYEGQKDERESYQYASHLLHMLQFGGRIVNRLQAGEHLLDVMKHLKASQRYEIILELDRVLEINEYAIAKYVPRFLGRLLFCLSEREQRDFLERLRSLITGKNIKAAAVALETVGVYLEWFPELAGSGLADPAGPEPFGTCTPPAGSEPFGIGTPPAGSEPLGTGMPPAGSEPLGTGTPPAGSEPLGTGTPLAGLWPIGRGTPQACLLCPDLLEEALGLLCIGLSHYEAEISRESLYITGQRLFGEKEIPPVFKETYFSFLARKILSLTDWRGKSLTRYYTAAALHYMYTFITDHELTVGRCPLKEDPLPCAFFPGTFDPFSLGHARIVEEIRRMGYRVYLAADEFSWSKRTQPFEVRRKIMEMSTARMRDVYLFPEEIPVNIAFPEDIRRLIGALNGKVPALVAGSDVVKNASAYRKEPRPFSVQTLPHIIFARDCSEMDEKEITGKLLKKPEFLHLPPHLESISSTLIRDNINEGREISALVSRLAENYIQKYGLYAMEPAYKKTALCLPVETVIEDDGICILQESATDAETRTVAAGKGTSAAEKETASAGKDSAAAEKASGRRPCGKVWYHEINQGDLYGECHDVETASLLRRLVSGKIAVITRVEGEVSETDDKRLTAVNETLEWLQENSFSYALCFCLKAYADTLKAHGFVPVPGAEDIGIVDLRNPVVLFYDTISAIKDPLALSMKVHLAVRSAHLALLDAITAMYPGQLVLCFESGVMNYRLVKRIREENSGEGAGKMCVPFGKILKGNVVPDTVTKGLDTEKVFDEGLEHFTIARFPGYAPLDLQLRAIRSFHRPLILVDDLYHSGYRAEKILESCEREGITDVQLITGVLSGRGKDLARDRNIRISSVYSVPNMKTWFIESDLYPFLGGDSVSRSEERAMQDPAVGSLEAPPLSLPSINTILPYEVPGFLRDVSLDAVYHLSEVCLANARNLFLALEEEYSRLYGRRLVTERLREVIAEPRHPDSVSFDEAMLRELTSDVIERQQKRLGRLRYPANRK